MGLPVSHIPRNAFPAHRHFHFETVRLKSPGALRSRHQVEDREDFAYRDERQARNHFYQWVGELALSGYKLLSRSLDHATFRGFPQRGEVAGRIDRELRLRICDDSDCSPHFWDGRT